ncbi:hypothetical protein [Rubripirellula reticaptiva]|nr:hypothetical protein [Rubripirellula reticaptiva]
MREAKREANEMVADAREELIEKLDASRQTQKVNSNPIAVVEGTAP